MECIFPATNPSNRGQNLLFRILMLEDGAGVWVSPTSKGHRSKGQFLTERRAMAFSCGQSEKQHCFSVQSTKTSTALNRPTPVERHRARQLTWIPNPCYAANSATRTSCSLYDMRIGCWKTQGKHVAATADSLDVLLILVSHLTVTAKGWR